MKAARVAKNRDMEVVDLDQPVAGAGEVLIDVEYCGICGSDLHMVDWPEEMLPAGLVLGHEFTGTIAGLGDGTEGWGIGQQVVVMPMVACGECESCRRGRPNACENGLSKGPGLGRNGGYAQQVAIPAGMLYQLPDSVTVRDGALTEPLAVGIRGIVRSEATADDAVCVLGGGPIGLMTAVGQRARGGSRIVVVEPKPARRRALEELGFKTLSPDEAVEGVKGAVGEEPPFVIDCTGHPSGVPLAIELLAPAGRLVVVGIPNEPVSVDLLAATVKEIEIRTSLAYSAEDFAEALDHIAAGRIPADQIVTKVADLDEVQSWFEDLKTPDSEQVKVMLRP